MAQREADVPDHRRIRYRVGVNLGDIVIEDDDVFGDGVNIAARLEALAKPGEVCVSRTVFDHVKTKVDTRRDVDVKGGGRWSFVGGTAISDYGHELGAHYWGH